MELTCESTVKHLKKDLTAFLVSCCIYNYVIISLIGSNTVARPLYFLIFNLCHLVIEENITNTPTAKAVRCFNVFNHDSWPEDKLELLDHGVKEVKFLLEHYSNVLNRWVFAAGMGHGSVDIITEIIYWEPFFCYFLLYVRNRCNNKQAIEEFQEMKMTINTSFKDKVILHCGKSWWQKSPTSQTTR